MSLTSLGLATDGLLDRGNKPTLHIAVLGHLRTAGEIIGGGIASGASALTRMIKREEEEILSLVVSFTEVIRRK